MNQIDRLVRRFFKFRKNMDETEIERLLVEYGNAMYECGRFDVDNEDNDLGEYGDLCAIVEEKKKAVLNALLNGSRRLSGERSERI